LGASQFMWMGVLEKERTEWAMGARNWQRGKLGWRTWRC
jgi:hypothetical protein